MDEDQQVGAGRARVECDVTAPGTPDRGQIAGILGIVIRSAGRRRRKNGRRAPPRASPARLPSSVGSVRCADQRDVVHARRGGAGEYRLDDPAADSERCMPARGRSVVESDRQPHRGSSRADNGSDSSGASSATSIASPSRAPGQRGRRDRHPGTQREPSTRKRSPSGTSSGGVRSSTSRTKPGRAHLLRISLTSAAPSAA